MTKDEELARYMAIIEQYKEQMSQLEMQGQYLQAAVADYHKAKLTIEQLNNAEKDTEILLPIGGSSFITATTKEPSKVLFDIGAGIVAEKTSEDAIKRIEKRLEELQKTQERLIEAIQNLQNEAAEVSAKAQKLMQEEQK